LSEKNSFIPIVLFTYKRLEVTKRVVESLLLNKECCLSRLIVYSDGPKSSKDVVAVEAVRAYLKSITGFECIEYIYRENNLGLAQSFIKGITETLTMHEKAIFLEDDNLLSEYFLRYMNQALNFYADNLKVICVTGYSWPIWPKQESPYFMRNAETWTMGTWRRGWSHFNSDGANLLDQICKRKLKKGLSRDGFGVYKMLKNQVAGRIDSWGVRWWVSAYIEDMYCLYPHEPLCVSIGYGGESVHCAEYSPLFRYPKDLATTPILNFPKVVSQPKLLTLSLKIMNLKLLCRRIIMRLINVSTFIFNK